jgi:predicted amidohydrolase
VFFWRGARDAERAAAEPSPGPTTERLAALAAELRVHLVGGSLLEAVPGMAKAYNTCTVFDPYGCLLATYRKVHLFDVDIPGHVSVRESDTRAPGREPVTVATELGTLGLSICYDLRFPSCTGGSAPPVPRSSACRPPSPSRPARTIGRSAARPRHRESGLRGRAESDRARPQRVVDYGHSMIVDPWGKVLVEAAREPGVFIAEIDPEASATARARIPALANDRAFTPPALPAARLKSVS